MSKYTLYGSYASYYTAKSRSYLRKKGIPFEERIPAHPRFREYVRPTSGKHHIPQIEAPDGTVVQDSTAIFNFLEERFPEPAARPPGIRQQWACRILEAVIDPALLNMAWHFRWNFMETNYGFVGREFGRSFKPRGSDAEVDNYGQVIADRMSGYRQSMGITERHFPALVQLYDDVLDILEAHVTTRPYLFGGLPSIADHALMGPLFGHLARDPEPAMRMKKRAPRVFRWTEHMNTPEIIWPELYDEPPQYLANDEIPESTLALLQLLVSEAQQRLRLTAEGFANWVRDTPDHSANTPIAKGEAHFGQALLDFRGEPLRTTLNAHFLWVWQGTQDWLDNLHGDDRASCDTLLREIGGDQLVAMPRPRRLCRINNALCVS
ncbi:MAG: glutathione S-transferase family protein [Halieaceae bacterium]|jgi:glutathione S-transferase|nr:glutathione S-transferase family protein [Halieaceae bacterium]